MLKLLPGLERFSHRKDTYKTQAIIGENGGNDTWPVNVEIWKEPHEQTWRYSYECKGDLVAPKIGKVYGPKSGSGEGLASAADARKALEAVLAEDYA